MITDIHSLGTEYNITDRSGIVIKTLQLVPHEEILEAAVGIYDESHGTFDDYLKKSVSVLSGFDNVNAGNVLWYATHDEEVVAKEIIEIALAGNYDYVILEKLEDTIDDL